MFEYNIRKATKQEQDFFENRLYPLQREVFAYIQSDRFYLSGGTCLCHFYYQHRYSEDLDFFFDGYHFPVEEFEIIFRDIMNRLSNKFKIEISLNDKYFKRGFIYRNDVILKLEFIYENFKNAGERIKTENIVIDSKENIATNKLTAVVDRKTIKDFVDLYYLLQDIDFMEIVKWAEYKIIPLDYEGILLTFTDQNLEGTVLLQRELDLSDFNSFLNNLVNRMLDHAKKHD